LSRRAKAIDITDVDFEVPVASPHSSSITLDADFDDGKGLQEGSDIDVAQDFGFSASTDFEDELDMVLPESAEEEDSSATDIIPPPERADKNSILNPKIPRYARKPITRFSSRITKRSLRRPRR
jgi:hypothetical protein